MVTDPAPRYSPVAIGLRSWSQHSHIAGHIGMVLSFVITRYSQSLGPGESTPKPPQVNLTHDFQAARPKKKNIGLLANTWTNTTAASLTHNASMSRNKPKGNGREDSQSLDR